MRRVIKVGGSLLLRPKLKDQLDRWIDAQSPAENLIVVGGGSIVEAVRELDAVHSLDSDDVHWVCVELLESTRRLVQQLLPDWKTVVTASQFRGCVERGFSLDQTTLVSVASFYNRDCDTLLPKDWRTTTDAIAAYLAVCANADELVLLKSCDIDPDWDLDRLIDDGVVDDATRLIAPDVRLVRVERLPTQDG
ncbi:MAG: protein kinase [Rubripirellula sp.]